MKKLKYIFRTIKNINIKNMVKVAKKIAHKNYKLTLFVLIDIIYCGFKYGSGYYDYQEFEFYKLKRNERKTYLTRTKNNIIIKTFNKKDYFYLLDDKVKFNDMFKEYIKRDYLFVSSPNELRKFIKKHPKFIAKIINGEGGKGINIYDSHDYELNDLYNKLKDNNQLLIEELISQHKDINKLYDKSVNTLRLFTFYDGKDSYVLNSVFKLGNGGVTDNFSSGSMYTFVNDEGFIIAPAIDQNDNVYFTHPISKQKILDQKIPFYKDACEMVKQASKLIPNIQYIGWDVAITSKGPVIIEGNSYPGVFQIRPSFTKDHIGLIPKYEKYMKIKLR